LRICFNELQRGLASGHTSSTSERRLALWPVGLAIGIAWAGPFEHLLQDAWGTANCLFPGPLLGAFVAWDISHVSASRALLTVTAYALIAGTIAATSFARRDITA
jgi:ABC-2 type transport system permease protein